MPNDGMPSGAPAYGAGKFAKGIVLNGTTQFVALPGGGGYEWGSNTQWTLTGWIKITADKLGTYAIAAQSGTGGNWLIGVDNGKIFAGVAGFDGPQPFGQFGRSIAVNDNLWHFIALRVSGAGLTAVATIYVDGASAGNSTGEPNADRGYIRPGGTLTTLIGELAGANIKFPGLIDEVAFFTSGSAILSTTVPTAAYVGNEPNLVALYHFNDSTQDSSDDEPVPDPDPTEPTVSLPLPDATIPTPGWLTRATAPVGVQSAFGGEQIAFLVTNAGEVWADVRTAGANQPLISLSLDGQEISRTLVTADGWVKLAGGLDYVADRGRLAVVAIAAVYTDSAVLPDRWEGDPPPAAVVIAALGCDTGGTIGAPTGQYAASNTLVWLWDTDSLGDVVGNLGSVGGVALSNATLCYPHLVSGYYGARIVKGSISGLGYTRMLGPTAHPAAYCDPADSAGNTSLGRFSKAAARPLAQRQMVKRLSICLGTNDQPGATLRARVAAAIAGAKVQYPNLLPDYGLIIQCPLTTYAQTPDILQAVATHLAANPEDVGFVGVVDIGEAAVNALVSVPNYVADLPHLTALGQQVATYKYLIPAFEALLNPSSAPIVTVTGVTLPNRTIPGGTVQQLVATVQGTGGTPDQAVTYAKLSGSVADTVTSGGLLSLGAGTDTPRTLQVRATSVADTTKSATATITIPAAVSSGGGNGSGLTEAQDRKLSDLHSYWITDATRTNAGDVYTDEDGTPRLQQNFVSSQRLLTRLDGE